jgi:hypothetical protein
MQNEKSKQQECMVYEFSSFSPCCATEHLSSCRLASGHFKIFRFVIRKKKLLSPVREITANEWLKGKEMPVIYSGGATPIRMKRSSNLGSAARFSRLETCLDRIWGPLSLLFNR